MARDVLLSILGILIALAQAITEADAWPGWLRGDSTNERSGPAVAYLPPIIPYRPTPLLFPFTGISDAQRQEKVYGYYQMGMTNPGSPSSVAALRTLHAIATNGHDPTFGRRQNNPISTRVYAHCALATLAVDGWHGAAVGAPEYLGNYDHPAPGRAGFTAAALGKMLGPYGIKSRTIRIGAETAKGYYLKDFEDAFKRYASGQGVTAVTSLPGNALDGDTAVTSREDVTASPRRKPVTSKPVSAVTAASNGRVGNPPANVEERL